MSSHLFILCFFFFIFFHNPLLVFSLLSPNQNTTMINLSNTLNTSKWGDINKHPDPCSWKGVNCTNSNSSVIQISLSAFSLYSSDFLPLVCQIESLQILDVSANHLTTIPPVFISDCGKISALKLLNFSSNNLEGPLPQFDGFSALESLDLAHNRLNGTIDLQLDGLVSLKSLNLSFNQFGGSIPTHLGKSMVLEELELAMNKFQGIIPVDFTVGYKNLSLIDVSGNHLSGEIPGRIGELSKLEVLILSGTNLSGQIPQGLVSNITSLWRFAANSNNLSGPIPAGITKHLRNLDLSYNSLSGRIPADLLSPSNLQTVDLSNNRLQGSIPTNISTSLVRLRLGSNALDDVIPGEAFARLNGLTYLELEDNSITGFIPPQLGSCRNLALLNLAQNRLSGVLPVELGNLTHLQVLKLQMNNLGGEIPIQITQLSKLSILNISRNSLNGSIPPSVSRLQSLFNMNLQGNNLIGPIPDRIGSMNSLLELQLGENHLEGDIPLMPTSLQIALNLSYNLFEGPIPETLSRLISLEILDLSNNKFSGVIPPFFVQLWSLTQLLLSNNQLSGVIPKFGTHVMVNHSGNTGLIHNTATTTRNKEKPVAVTIILIVVAGVVAIGAITIITAIILSRSNVNYRVNNEQVESGEDVPEVVQGTLLTSNGIHRSNIDFSKAMEVVSERSSIVLKTRFSTYYKAIMPSGASYFVKKLNWSDKIFQLSSLDNDGFAKDLEMFGKLSNSNVMCPLAYVLTVDSGYLLYEFAPKGTLCDALHGRDGEMDWGSRYSIAVGVAQGIAFLHGCTPSPILLLDLSSQSIFLKSLKEPVIGEAELCKVIDPSKSTGSLSTIAGSVGYIPPEYAYTMRVTMAGNVYSFGVILLELVTGKPAVNEGIELANWVLSNNSSAQQHKWDHFLDYSISTNTIAVRSQMLAVLKLALTCVSASPEARPRMKTLLRMLLNAT